MLFLIPPGARTIENHLQRKIPEDFKLKLSYHVHIVINLANRSTGIVMKHFSTGFRIIVAAAGLLLVGFAAYLGWQTWSYLSEHTLSAAEKQYQQARLGAHVVIASLGISLMVLAIPGRKNASTHRSRWTFYGGIFMLCVFLSSFGRYISGFANRKVAANEDDLSSSVGAIVAELIVAVVLLKWKTTSPPK